ncbi:MAG TPA: hypothetical protein VFL13_06885 [Candidatus Baltobacteraceae bacterium]|nr:hypothetical protein [Candidatus Baltobacteraceae bacterium]
MRTLLLSLVLPLLAVTEAAAAIPSPVRDIAAANRHYITALQAGHPAEIALDYEAGGRFLSARADIRGRAQLGAFFSSRMRGITLVSGSCATRHLEVYGVTATETGECRLVFERSGHVAKSEGPYVTVWAYDSSKKRWLIRFDVIPG